MTKKEKEELSELIEDIYDEENKRDNIIIANLNDKGIGKALYVVDVK